MGEDGEVVEIFAAPDAFADILKALEEGGVEASESTVTQIAENKTEVTDVKTAEKVFRLLDTLEDYDDAQQVISNADISDEIAEQLD